MAQPRICSLIRQQAPVQANRGYLDASGATVPTNGTDGYQTGCIFRHTDGSAETALYVNEGSVTSCTFVPLLTTSNEVQDLPDFGAMTYGAGKILVADGDSYEEVAVSGDATLASTGSLSVTVVNGVTAGTAAASKAVILDAYKTARIGTFNTGGATTNAIPFASVPNSWSDGQLDIIGVFGGSSTNIGSGSSAKCIRARHIVNAAAATVEHETYGLVGQLVIKDTTLGHLHAGIMGTFEGHTSGVIIDGGYTVGAACITARLGGHAAITATDPIAGFLAFNNGAAALAAGNSCAFATSMASASYPWTIGAYMPVGSVNIGIRIGNWVTGGGTGGAIAFATTQNFNSDGQLGIVSCFGESTADLTNAYNAHVGRFRHLVSGTGLSVAQETYGVCGQLVVKGTTLTHLHAGILGSMEGNTSGAVSNGAYMYSTGAIIARVGGGAAITATKDVCGVIAFLNGAAMASGACSAFAVGDQGTAAWTNAIAVERATNLFDLPAAGTDPVIANALVPAAAPDAGTVGADACLRVLVNTTAYYIPLYDTLHA